MIPYSEVETITLFGRENSKVFKNRPQHLNEVFNNAVSNYGDDDALILNEQKLSYKEVDNLTDRIAATLQKKYDIKQGDFVLLLVGNLIEFATSVIACAKLGAVTIPVNTKLQANEIDYIIGHSKPKLLIIEDSIIPIIEQCQTYNPAINEFTKQIIVIGNAKNYDPFDSLITDDINFTEANLQETDPAFILYTSGTTGRPKGAVLSHINVIHTLIHYRLRFDTDHTMATMVAVPLFHVTGLVAQFLHMIFVGGTTVILRHYQNEAYIEQAHKHKVDFHFNVPTIFIMMATSPLLKEQPFDYVKLVAYGGSPIYLQTLEKLHEIFPNATFRNAYGATETASPATIMPAEYNMDKANSVGLPVELGEIKIMNTDGEELAVNQVGEIYIKGPMVIGEYLNNPDANADAFIDGFWRSGDIGKIDEDGFIYVLDRMKDMINRGGEKIFSIEVENVLKSHPEIIEAAVVATPDDVYGERVKAIVVSETLNDNNLNSIIDHCASKLAKYKIPEVYSFIDELPKTASGKVMKHKLR